MNSDKPMCKCKKTYKKIKMLSLFGMASLGVGTIIYLGLQKSSRVKEDKESYERYEDENPDEDYKSRMDFYEAEFKRQDEEEEKELKKVVEEFNSKRLNRVNCPHCGNKKRMREKRDRRLNKKSMIIKETDFPKEAYEDSIYLEK